MARNYGGVVLWSCRLHLTHLQGIIYFCLYCQPNRITRQNNKPTVIFVYINISFGNWYFWKRLLSKPILIALARRTTFHDFIVKKKKFFFHGKFLFSERALITVKQCVLVHSISLLCFYGGMCSDLGYVQVTLFPVFIIAFICCYHMSNQNLLYIKTRFSKQKWYNVPLVIEFFNF